MALQRKPPSDGFLLLKQDRKSWPTPHNNQPHTHHAQLVPKPTDGDRCATEFRAWLKDGFSFQRMKPVIPADSSTQCPAWGTKWDLDDNEQHEVASELLEIGAAFFDTAWSPPIQAIEALSRKFPEVSFQLDYCELGNIFAGTAMFHDGECHDDFHEVKADVMKIACDIFGYEDEEACDLVA
jgi:hypothetical protein